MTTRDAFTAVRREQFQTLRDAITALKGEGGPRSVGLVLDILELLVRGQDDRIAALEAEIDKLNEKATTTSSVARD